MPDSHSPMESMLAGVADLGAEHVGVQNSRRDAVDRAAGTSTTRGYVRRTTLVLGAAACLALSPATAANAGNYYYDARDPVSTGCSRDGRTVQSAPIVDQYGNRGGTIELRYSARCRSVWARISGVAREIPGVQEGGKARVVRNNDGRSMSCLITVGTSCYTTMLYDGGMTSYAKGWYMGSSSYFDTRTAAY